MIGIGAFCISVARRASSDASLVSGLSSASSAIHRSRTASALPVSALVRSANWHPFLTMGVAAPSPRLGPSLRDGDGQAPASGGISVGAPVDVGQVP